MQQNLITTYLATQVLNIAKAAGRSMMAIYAMQSQIIHKTKTDGSPITQVDTSSHQIISEGLAHLTPGIPIVSEENTDSWKQRQQDNIFWLIDPLDGTKEFISKNGEFTTNIALIKEGFPVFGCITVPALELSYWGGIGLGAFQNTKTMNIHKTPTHTTQPIRIVVSKSHLNQETHEFISKFPHHELVKTGSSLKFCRIAEQMAECYPRLGPTCEWDTAAGQAIIEAAGGYVETLEGQRLSYGKPNVINPYFVASTMSLMNLNKLLESFIQHESIN